MSEGATILCAGRIYCDLVFTGLDAAPEPGREVFADALKICAGGGAYITAAYLAALGEHVGLVGMLPAAPFGAIVRAEMDHNGVHAFCEETHDEDAQLTAALVTKTDRAFVTRRVGKAVPQSKIDALPLARHLHIGELTTALEHRDLLQVARASGMTISLDCSWDGQVLARNDVAEIIALVDLFLPNEDEARALETYCTHVQPRLATIVKRGPEGASCLRTGRDAIHAPGHQVELVDTTGAGDAFNAGFLSAWLAGQSMEAALALGNACGATAVSRVGGAGALPDLSGMSAADPLRQAAQ